jgi:hypothetical protein
VAGASAESPSVYAGTKGGEPLTLASIRAQWPAIVKALNKINLTAAASAESGWEVCALDGMKLTVRPLKPIEMYLEQLKTYLPDLTQAVREVVGAELILTAKSAELPPPAPPQAAGSVSSPSVYGGTKGGDATENQKSKIKNPVADAPVTSGDMFEQFLHRFGGEEVDPARAKEPK